MIPLGAPNTGEAEIQAVRELLESGRISTGDVVSRFENEFASFAGRDHGAAVASGSVALELALEALFEPGDKVVLSPYNCGSVLYSLLREDLIPVYADMKPNTYNISPDAVRSAINSDLNPDGLLISHLYGQPADMEALSSIATDYDLTVVEDFAQAPGARYNNSKAGSFGAASICSFGATKNITTAEGGIVVADDSTVIEQVRNHRNNTWSDAHVPPRSVRMNDLEAAVGREQLRKYDEVLERKQAVAEKYNSDLPEAVGTPSVASNRTHVFHGYPVRVESRGPLRVHLSKANIESAAVYDTALYEYQADPTGGTTSMFPATARATKEVLLLPIHPQMTIDEASRVVEIVTDFYGE